MSVFTPTGALSSSEKRLKSLSSPNPSSLGLEEERLRSGLLPRTRQVEGDGRAELLR